MTTPTVTDFLPPFPTIGLPPDEVVDALVAGAVGIHRRAEIYESDGVTPFAITQWDARLTSGSVTVDSTRDERRMCDLELNNFDFALNLNPVNGFWYDKIIKVFWGIEYYNLDGDLSRWEMQVGEFMIDTIAEDYFPNVCKVTGRDYTKKCVVSKILNSIQFNSSTPVEVIIKALAANSGVKKFRLPYTGLSFADDIVFDPFTARWEVIKKLADSVGYEVYFTSDGYLTMRPYQDPVLSPVSWIFRTGQPDGTLVTYRRSSNDSRVKNHSVVIGNTQTDNNGFSVTAFGEARNDDPGSPTWIGRIGDRVDEFKSSYITDNDVAQALAESRFRVSSLEEYSIDFSSLILPFVDAGDIVDILNSNESSYVPARFLLSSYTLPLGLGAMTGIGRRVTIVGTTRTFGVF